MADYKLADARFTMVMTRKLQRGGIEIFERAGFDLVRFNVDIQPDAPFWIIPVGDMGVSSNLGVKPDADKQWERIWVVDGGQPFRGKTYFGQPAQ
jgi:hypothetical protein